MLEAWKQKGLQVKLKRAFAIWGIISIVLGIMATGALLGNFGTRFQQLEKSISMEPEFHRESFSELGKWDNNIDDLGDDKEKIMTGFYLYSIDIALILCCGIMVIVLGIWYWMLCVIWALQKSCRMGVNSTLWVIGTFFFNFAAIILLYMYGIVKGTCKNCGKIVRKNELFCSRCGSELKKICSYCGQTIELPYDYCGYCGKKWIGDSNKE